MERTFSNFVAHLEDERTEESPAIGKLRHLTNLTSASVFEFIEDCATFDAGIDVLENMFIKTPNEIFARYLLATRKQVVGESLHEFFQALQILRKNCQCKDVSGEQYRQELCRDAFINGLLSPAICQRLLENETLDLKTAFDQANALDAAQRNSLAYNTNSATAISAAKQENVPLEYFPGVSYPSDAAPSNKLDLRSSSAAIGQKKCYFCGYNYHPRKFCPARNEQCNKCKKMGHFEKVCKGKARLHFASMAQVCALCPKSSSSASIPAVICETNFCALVDSGSFDNYISRDVARLLNAKILPCRQEVSMAQISQTSTILGVCIIDIIVNNNTYNKVRFGVIEHLCSDLILGQAFQKLYKRLIIEYDGLRKDIIVAEHAPCALPEAHGSGVGGEGARAGTHKSLMCRKSEKIP